MSEFPQWYSTQLAIGNATTCADTVSFGFNAEFLRLANYEAVDIYIDLQGNKASTSAMYLRACSDVYFSNTPPIAGVGAKTTSTAATDKILRITAMRA